MNLKDISKEELEAMSYDDIAYLILENNKRKMKIFDLFKKVCDVLGLPVETVEEHISDFFELLSTNKKFVLLPNGYWDLAINHVQEMIVEDDDDDLASEELEDENLDEDIIDSENEEDENIYYDDDLDDADEDDDDLKDLIIVDDEENSQE